MTVTTYNNRLQVNQWYAYATIGNNVPFEMSARLFEKKDYKPTLVSRPAPNFDMTTMGGEHFSSASLHGKPFVMNFWATWCGPCMKEAPHMVELNIGHSIVSRSVTTGLAVAVKEMLQLMEGYLY